MLARSAAKASSLNRLHQTPLCLVGLVSQSRNLVDEMATRTWLSSQDPQFNSFLFAPVGEDRNGMLVSVLSALARVGVDPWEEAKQLAGLSAESARIRLDKMIAVLPGIPSLTVDHQAVANRLVALLPRGTSLAASVSSTVTGGDETERKRKLGYITFIVFLVISQSMMLFHRPVPPIGQTNAPISTAAHAGKAVTHKGH